MSFLSTLGGDIKKVFAWIGSPKVQAVVKIGEAVVEDFFPAATGAINILNTWTTEIFKAEAMAEAAAAAPGDTTNLQKAAAVINAITPQILTFAQANKLPPPTAATIQAVNDSLVAAINALSGKLPTPPAA